MKKRKLLVALLLSTPVLPAFAGSSNTYFSVLPYGGSIDYSSSKYKDNGYFAGIYSYLGIGLKHSIEGEINYTKIKYLNGSHLNQYDFTALYTFYPNANLKLRAGAHYISSDDDATDGGIIGFVGADYYQAYKWLVGLDLYYSNYGDYNTNNVYGISPAGRQSDKGLTVYQTTPKFGFYLGNPRAYGTFYFETKGYYIHLSDDVSFGKDFYSIEENIYYYYQNLVFKVSGWVGEQSFAVKNNGFAVYNLSEKYKYGYLGEVKYIFNRYVSMSAGVGQDKMKEYSSKDTATITTAYLTVGVGF